MLIAIIGAGAVGKALGLNWLKCGHDVRFGVRNPDDAKYVALGRDRLFEATAGIPAADVIVIATPWKATEKAILALGDLSGKIIIDVTTPLAMGPNGLGLAIGHSTSAGEQVATWAKGASVYKTLNQTGAENMADAAGYPRKPLMFVAGDDLQHKPLIVSLVAELGFEAIDAGPLVNARLLEPLAMLWVELAIKQGQTRDFAFTIERR
jgi:8-hydroxy-5-deazaflavin:NADPH oxidoreductase